MNAIEMTIQVDEFAGYLNFIIRTYNEEEARIRISAYQVLFTDEQWAAISSKAKEMENVITH